MDFSNKKGSKVLKNNEVKHKKNEDENNVKEDTNIKNNTKKGKGIEKEKDKAKGKNGKEEQKKDNKESIAKSKEEKEKGKKKDEIKEEIKKKKDEEIKKEIKETDKNNKENKISQIKNEKSSEEKEDNKKNKKKGKDLDKKEDEREGKDLDKKEENKGVKKEEKKEGKKGENKENKKEGNKEDKKGENKEDKKGENKEDKKEGKKEGKKEEKKEGKKEDKKGENKEDKKGENKDDKKEGRKEEKKEGKKEDKKGENKEDKKGENKEDKKGENKEDKKRENEEDKKKNKNEKIEEKIILNKNIKARGLNNIGATCYMNSVLQCLYHVFDLSNELLKLKNIDERKIPMTYAFLEVIYRLSFDEEDSISPYKFKKIISNNELFEGIEANDSKALVLYILETLNEELSSNNIKFENKNIKNKIRDLKDKDTENIVNIFNKNYNSIIADLFNGLKMTTYKCLTCGDSPANYQIFNIINLSIEQTFYELKKKKYPLDLIDCLRVEHCAKEFNGDNQLFCDKCDKLVDGESFDKIYIAPKIMIIFLDRGMYNRFKCEVNFPEKLNINEFEEIKEGEYHLIGVIEHLGPSSLSGHFVANCKHFDGNWYLFNDSRTICTKGEYHQFGEPYLLFYRRE